MKLTNGGVELPLSRARLQVFAWWRMKKKIEGKRET
jgi:hypothetical protein